MADDGIVDVEDFALPDLPGHLRTAACASNRIELHLTARGALRIARAIENGLAAAPRPGAVTWLPIPDADAGWRVRIHLFLLAVQVGLLAASAGGLFHG